MQMMTKGMNLGSLDMGFKSDPANNHSSQAPKPVATPSQFAQSAALTSVCFFSQAELKIAKIVQHTIDARA